MEYIDKTIETIDKFLTGVLGFSRLETEYIWRFQQEVPVGQVVINGRAQYQMTVREITVSTNKEYDCYDYTNTDESTEENYIGLNVRIEVKEQGETVQLLEQICKSDNELRELFSNK